MLLTNFAFIDLDAGASSALTIAGGVGISLLMAALKKVWPNLKNTTAYALLIVISGLTALFVLYSQGELHTFSDLGRNTQALVFWSVTTYHFLVARFTKPTIVT